jgi:hypothetical protein
MISHVHGTAVYGRVPALADDDEEAFDNGTSTLNFATELSTANPASASAPKAPVPGKDADDDDDEGVTGSFVEQDITSGGAGKKRKPHPAPPAHNMRSTRLGKKRLTVDPVFIVDNTNRSATSNKCVRKSVNADSTPLPQISDNPPFRKRRKQ